MSQDASDPTQLTTMTNVADALNQAVRTSPNLKDALITLRTLGMSPSELRNALGPLADDPQIRSSIELASGPDYVKSFDALDPERRKESLEEWRGVLQAARRAKELAEEFDAPEESDEHASKLGSALDKAHTFEEKVHAFEDHFAAGGAIWETAEAMGLSREDAQKVKEREKELSEKWDREHQGEREKVAEELLRKGIAKNKEEAERMAKEREDAQRTKDNFQRMEREGMFHGADPELLAANKKAIEDRAKKYDREMASSLATAPAPWAVKAEAEAVSKAAASGTLTHAQELAMKAGEATHTKGGLAKLKDDKELQDFAVKALIKADGSALGKELGVAAAATGAISKEDVKDAKVGEKDGAKVSQVATSADDFDSASAPVAVAAADIKGKLASMRNAEAPAPASKGPSLA